MKLTLERTVTTEECPWLPHGIEAGTSVHKFQGVTYGAISYSGIAITFGDDPTDHPFYEIPLDSVGLPERYIALGGFK